MGSKIEFVEKARERGANISALCREYGISRQTGHKWVKRYEEAGYNGLEEKTRRPSSTPLATGEDIVVALLALRAKYPRWGPKKLVVVLRRTLGPLTPSERTVHRLLRALGQTRLRRKKRGLSVVERAPDETALAPNDIWTIDFKGWWRAADGKRCDPLTVRDAFSRYVLSLKLVVGCTGEQVRAELTRLFRRHGVPKAIQCDNGSPFISSQSMGGISCLSAWWLSLGIRIVRSRPACPQDNGAHERMHVDVAGDLQANPAASVHLQQRACDRWRQTFNNVRPHEALGQRTPAELYRSTPTQLRPKPTSYPLGWMSRAVCRNGNIRISGEDYFISTAVRGYRVGLEPRAGLRYRVWLFDFALGEIEIADLLTTQLEKLAS